MLADEAEIAVRAIVEEAVSAPAGSEERKFGDLYASFMDAHRAERLGSKPISPTLAAVRAVSSVPGAAGDARAAAATGNRWSIPDGRSRAGRRKMVADAYERDPGCLAGPCPATRSGHDAVGVSPDHLRRIGGSYPGSHRSGDPAVA
jgi:hypothetical protein